jgi:hypothetical protein
MTTSLPASVLKTPVSIRMFWVNLPLVAKEVSRSPAAADAQAAARR